MAFGLALGVAVAANAAEISFNITESKANAALAAAVVSLVPLEPSAPLPTRPSSAAPIEIVQEKQEFVPVVTAIRVGTAVRLPNRDTVAHHVYSESPVKRLEFPLYEPGKAETVVFDQPGVVALGCNIHDWMLAYVVVLQTPWFAVTPASGIVTLTDIPPGRYRAEVWHARLAKPETRELVVGDAAPATLDFALRLRRDQRIRRPVDAGGKGYR